MSEILPRIVEETLPRILDQAFILSFETIDPHEIEVITKASELLELGFPEYSLIGIWNAAVHNIRRRVEGYSIEMFLSSTKEESGRKKYNHDGDSISDRWNGVDDLVLINGATKLGILNKKAGKSLEMINWMRNHASPAHDNDENVQREDVIGLVLILQRNLFQSEMPDPGHSPSGLFAPIKEKVLDHDQIELLKAQVESFNNRDIRTIFGFMLDILCNGQEPSYTNIFELFPVCWSKATEELKQNVGSRYHSIMIDIKADDSVDKGAKTRLVEFLIGVEGIKYIPDAARAVLYKRLTKDLAKAKDSAYGWNLEDSASKGLAQLGAHVPSIAFEEVYQEILSSWCGNYWGRSETHIILSEFINSLKTNEILTVCKLFKTNERVKSELFQSRPNSRACDLLISLKEKLSIQTHITEVDSIIEVVRGYY